MFEVLSTIESDLKSATVGLNKRIETAAAELDHTPAPMQTVDVWDVQALPTELTLPACMVDYTGTDGAPLQTQGKEEVRHRVQVMVWLDATEQPRKDLAVYYKALRRWLNALPGKGNIANVEDDSIAWTVDGWLLGGRRFTMGTLAFTLVEYDTTP